MADVSRRRSDLATHPDMPEMRERYARLLQGRDVVFVDGPVLVAGLYCAISPWVVHFSGQSPDLMINNLIIGLAVAVIGFGLAQTPARMYGLSGALAMLGAWLIVSPWVVTDGPDAGMIWNNVVVGAITCLLGLFAAAMLARTDRTGTTAG
ncbi:SPW repeat protein [Streptomyces sp. GC420]|uniref:SPW repeat protein n=1 Tax=Streptomyces sp. GC420 TaxID=2697568 RepID=UPI001414D840|nr:SPW repeat protein [Streptomyces sp. GC420]NBM16540.1 hypothetical protein [Streptomyces sp. GC420]